MEYQSHPLKASDLQQNNVGYEDNDASSSASTKMTVFVEEWGDGARNWVRSVILLNPWFERFWLLIIIANCVVLAMEDPTDKDCETERCKFTKIADYVFTNLFVVEMVLKLIGYGTFRRHDSYLRDVWCLIDGLIVVSGVIAFLLDVIFSASGPALTGLRAFRLLRPLKAIQSFPAVRILIQSILASLPKLGDVFVLYFFFVLVMGIISLQQWKGSLSVHCATEESYQAALLEDNDSLVELAEDGRVCTNSSYFHVGGHLCDFGYVCVRHGGNPEGGLLSFDNIGVAALTLFVALTLEGWTDAMYETMDATTYFAAFFWVILVIFGAFFILNLTIVIITEAFEMKQYEQKTSAFRAIDKDGGGELDKEEVRRLLKKLNGQDPSEEELDKVFTEMDTDGGGTVSLEEFLEYAEKHAATVGAALTKGRPGATGMMTSVKQVASKLPLLGNVKGAVERATEDLGEREEKRAPWRDRIYQVVEPTGLETTMPVANRLFDRTVMVVIILNTIALAIEHHGQPDEMTTVLEVFNYIFTIFFALEAAIKIIGLGIMGYVRDKFNIFDFIVSLLSVVGLFGVVGNVSVFRTFRALRVLRLAKQVPLLQRWIGILLNSMKGAAVLTSLLMLVVFIVALLGMQLFGGNFCHLDEDFDANAAGLTDAERGTGRGCGGVPRSNYDDLASALMTTFQILTGEDWNKIMYNGMRAAGDWVSVYYVLYYMLGNYMMLNLFIAVLLNSREMTDSSSSITEAPGDDDPLDMPASPATASPATLSKAISDDPASPKVEWQKLCDDTNTDHNEAASPVADAAVVLGRRNMGYQDAIDRKEGPKRRLPDWLNELVESERSLLVFSKDNVIRQKMLWIISTTAFEAVVLLCILVSTVTLALENPVRPPDHPQELLLAQVNFVMVWVFLTECFFKVVGMGFVLHKTSYLRSEGWNILDFVIVCVSLLSLVIPGGNSLEFIKIMRTLRPLRFINKSEGMKVVVQALVKSITPLLNVMLISLLVWVIFGIMGVQLFAGKFHRCSLNEYGDMDAITFRVDCLDIDKCSGDDGEPCRWLNYVSHFDHLPAAFLNLFEVASLEGWVDVMNLGIDSVSYDEAPRRNNNRWMALYFLIFVVFGAFFIINMFIGVLIDTYYQEKEKASSTGGIFLNDRQKLWVTHHTKMLNIMSATNREAVTRRQPRDSFLFKLMTSSACDVFITGCIILNVLLMATEHYPGGVWLDVLHIINLIFYGIFLLEAILKNLALGPTEYFKDMWNRFDMFIVCLSTVGVIMELVLTASPAVSIFRILRLARLLRMVKKAKGIKRILRTLLLSLPSMMNVAGILFLMFFVYAVLGVKLFAKLRRGGPDDAMGRYANFENFGFSLLLLLRMTTGEAWQSVLKEASVEPPHACSEHLGNCGHPFIAVVYFCSFTLAGMYVLLNLFIAVILDAFSQSNEEGVCTDEYMERIKYCWDDVREDDADGVDPRNLYSFLTAIGPPLGMEVDSLESDLEAFIAPMDLEVCPETGLILQVELIPKLFKMRYGQSLPDDLQEHLTAKEREHITLGRQVTGVSLKQQHSNVELSVLPSYDAALLGGPNTDGEQKTHRPRRLTVTLPDEEESTFPGTPLGVKESSANGGTTYTAPSLLLSSASTALLEAPVQTAPRRDPHRTPHPWVSQGVWPDGGIDRRNVTLHKPPLLGASLGFKVNPDTARVTTVEEGSVADASGITPGMRLTGVDGEVVTAGNIEAATKDIRYAKSAVNLELETPDPTDMLMERYAGPNKCLNFLQLSGMCTALGVSGPNNLKTFEAVCAAKGLNPRQGFGWSDTHEMMSALPYEGRRRVLLSLGLLPEERGLGMASSASPHHSQVVQEHWEEVYELKSLSPVQPLLRQQQQQHPLTHPLLAPAGSGAEGLPHHRLSHNALTANNRLLGKFEHAFMEVRDGAGGGVHHHHHHNHNPHGGFAGPGDYLSRSYVPL